MGRQFEAELAEELELSEDPALTRMGERIVSQTEMADLPWRFYVVRDETVNAFNVPGGLVYVHSGLIEAAGDEDELAAVVGHEIGHGVARHGTERLTQQYGMAVLAGVVLGEDPGVVSEIVAQVVAAGAVARFSREQEFEADELGVRHMADAGYDPEGMVSFLQRLLELQEREPGTVERFFATHPATEDRIEEVEGQIEEMRADR
jgi:beta-barrel assembly-enhancing protease